MTFGCVDIEARARGMALTGRDSQWGTVNIKMDEHTFEINRERAIDYLNTRDNVYVFDGFAGVSPTPLARPETRSDDVDGRSGTPSTASRSASFAPVPTTPSSCTTVSRSPRRRPGLLRRHPADPTFGSRSAHPPDSQGARGVRRARLHHLCVFRVLKTYEARELTWSRTCRQRRCLPG